MLWIVNQHEEWGAPEPGADVSISGGQRGRRIRGAEPEKIV
jgi:hypothetical protein